MNQRTIGILVTNTDHSEFASRWPRDGEKFSILLQSLRPQWSLKIYNCIQGEFPNDVGECDGYVIGGSPASVNDGDEWILKLLALIRSLNDIRKPVIGCCFGHQAIAKALGGEVGRNHGGWGFGVAQTYFSTNETWMQPAAQLLNLFAAHSEQVTTLPPEARIIGGDEFCPTAALAVGDHFMSTEYHPEMTKPFFVGLTHAFEKYIGADVAIRARLQAEDIEADGRIFASWMVHFFERD